VRSLFCYIIRDGFSADKVGRRCVKADGFTALFSYRPAIGFVGGSGPIGIVIWDGHCPCILNRYLCSEWRNTMAVNCHECNFVTLFCEAKRYYRIMQFVYRLGILSRLSQFPSPAFGTY